MNLHSEKLTPGQAVQRAIADSPFLKSVAIAQKATWQARGLRAVSADEIRILKLQHNAAEDWTKVWVANDFNPHKVVGSYFSGEVLLGSFKEKVMIEQGVYIGSGVYNCELSNVSVGNNAYLANNSLIANYHIGAGAAVRGCGSIVCAGETSFGNGQRVSLGMEASGRETALYAEITVEVAAEIAAYRKNREKIAEFEAMVQKYERLALSNVGIIEPGAIVQNVSKILNCYIGHGAVIDSATWLEESTVLSAPKEVARVTSGACIKDSVVQWGARVGTHAIVEHSALCEHSYVDCHGKASNSLIGPNTGISGGECMYSLVGPFVGFHHQALLIAAYWPEGKGNVGYGANVGANHTSKAPDQEIWPGEGLFFGLGCNIRFPSDFSKAPYSIIAAGIATLPQKCELPFSLINVRAETIDGVSPAYNEILPGWVLNDNIYAVRRNERKYAVRNKAARSQFGFEVFRPDIIDLLVSARQKLKNVDTKVTPGRISARMKSGAIGAVYTDKDIPALGKNFMKDTARLEGIEAYTFYIRLYALKGLFFALKFCEQQNLDFKRALDPGFISDPRYDHERGLLQSEFPGRSISQLLIELVKAHEKVAADTQLAKEKDDFRGVRIVPDYSEVHIPAASDPFVKTTLRETEELKIEVSRYMERL